MRDTRLQSFMTANVIRPAHLARESGISRQHLLRIRQGVAEPTRAVMVALAKGCSRLVRRQVKASELFDLDEKKPIPHVKADPKICNGVPCIAGTRVPVLTILASLAAGDSDEAIMRSFPSLTADDIRAAIDFAARLLKRIYHGTEKR